MKILFVCHRLPYPPNRGGKIRPFNIVRHLGEKHSVVVASLAHTEEELKAGSGLKDYCDEVIAEVLPSSIRWAQALTALPSRTPSSVRYFWSARLYERIQQMVRRTKFDAVMVHCAFVAQYVMNVDARVRVMDFGDLDSAKWAEYSKWKTFPFSRLYEFESRKLRAYERTVAGLFDHCTVTTEGERDEFRRLDASTPCTVIPNGVDTSFFCDSGHPTGSAIVFLGRMDYFPNIDGVCYFAEHIWPLVRKHRPDAELRIIGSNPARRIRELAKLPNTTVTGHVPDVRPYLLDAGVSVAPLRIARGTQNKILESMAMGLPVVATTEAAKGIQAVPGQHLLVAPNPTMFARQVIDLLENKSLRTSLAAAARKQITKTHIWPASMMILDGVLA